MPQEDKSKLASKREFQSEEFQEILGNILNHLKNIHLNIL